MRRPRGFVYTPAQEYVCVCVCVCVQVSEGSVMSLDVFSEEISADDEMVTSTRSRSYVVDLTKPELEN